MNKFITAVKALDLAAVSDILKREPKWLAWSEPSGKNALHYLCGLGSSDDPKKAEAALQILKLLIKSGMDINSIHKIPEKDGFFPGTPLWYAYTRGRNEKLYKYLLRNGANPDNCMWAIAWYDDIAAAKLWLKHGAKINESSIKLLVSRGADADKANDKGMSARTIAESKGQKGLLALL